MPPHTFPGTDLAPLRHPSGGCREGLLSENPCNRARTGAILGPTVSGGSLGNYLLTREELLRRAGDVIAGIRAGWLRLRIGKALPLAEAAEAHRLLEGRQTIGKLLLSMHG